MKAGLTGLRLAVGAVVATAVVAGVAAVGSVPASAAGTLSTTTLSASPGGAVVTGQPVTFTATVTPQSPATLTPTGIVVFAFSAGHVVCAGGSNSIALVDGAASCTVGLPGGASPIDVDARYLGDTHYDTSNAELSEVVGLADTTTVLSATIDHSIGSGKPINFVATVAAVAPATGNPTGSVTFALSGVGGVEASCANGVAVLLSRHLDTAKCEVPSGVLVASASPWTVTAIYSGDVNDAGSSNTYSQDVHAAVTTTHISSTPSPPSLSEPLQITASVTVPRFAVLPTGSLVFSFTSSAGTLPIVCEGGTNSLPLTSNYATCTLPAGVEPHGTKYDVQAAYSGDANNGSSTSGLRPLLVH